MRETGRGGELGTGRGSTSTGCWCNGDISSTTFWSRQLSTGRVLSWGLISSQLAIVLSDNPVALAGRVFKFPAVHDLHCATGALDEPLLLQNTSCKAHTSTRNPSPVICTTA